MNCNDCANYRLNADERMAKAGYGGCQKSIPGCYFAHTRPKCADYLEARADIVEKRIAWMRGSR